MGRLGLEPRTLSLKVRCSTAELPTRTRIVPRMRVKVNRNASENRSGSRYFSFGKRPLYPALEVPGYYRIKVAPRLRRR